MNPTRPHKIGDVIKASEMRLGDRVIMCSQTNRYTPFATSIVCHTTDAAVRLWRPYGTTSNYSHVSRGGEAVICYTGIEEYELLRDSHVEYWLVEEENLR